MKAKSHYSFQPHLLRSKNPKEKTFQKLVELLENDFDSHVKDGGAFSNRMTNSGKSPG